MEDKFNMAVNNIDEEKFITSYLNKNMRMLEFGSGVSTPFLAGFVKELVSLDHNPAYFDQTKRSLNNRGIKNVELIFVPHNKEEGVGEDGTFEEFQNYVLAPMKHAVKEKFDIVFVDGRARVPCCQYAAQYYLKPDGILFIHDYKNPDERYRRHEYEVIEEFLEYVGHEYAMYAFRIKNEQEQNKV